MRNRKDHLRTSNREYFEALVKVAAVVGLIVALSGCSMIRPATPEEMQLLRSQVPNPVSPVPNVR